MIKRYGMASTNPGSLENTEVTKMVHVQKLIFQHQFAASSDANPALIIEIKGTRKLVLNFSLVEVSDP